MPEPTKRYIPPPTFDRVYNMLLFGDLSLAELKHPMVIEKKDTYEFYFKPTPSMVFKYQIQDYEYDQSRACIKKEYSKDACFRASDYPTAWIILNDYNDQPLDNSFIRKINTLLLHSNKELTREIIGYRALMSQQSYEHLQQSKHPAEAKAKQMEELKKMKDVVGTTQEVYGAQIEQQQQPYEPR